MIKKIFILLTIICLSSPLIYAQLKKLSALNLHSEVEVYKDNGGNWYSTLVTVKFAKRTIDLPRGVKNATLTDVLISGTKGILEIIEKKYGKFTFEKLFPDASWENSIGTNIVTKAKVRLKDESQFYKLIFENIICVDSLINELTGLPNIVSAERPFVAISTYTPNDYSASEQWALPQMEATKAWDITRGSNQTIIGINDSFTHDDINYIHNELRNNKIVYNPDNLCWGHGQLVAGCAGALTDNGTGIAGIGFNSSLMLTSWNDPQGIAEARDNGAHIINCSWITSNYTALDTVVYNTLNQGIIMTAGVGNDTSNCGYIPRITYPAAYNYPSIGKQVIAVTATHLDNGSEVFGYPPNGRWNYSPGTDPIGNPTTGFVDFSAPGIFIKCLDDTITNGYMTASGTSMSAPEVAGVIALIRSIYPNLTPEIAYTILRNTAEKVGADSYDANGWNQYMGYGRVNAYQALKYTLEHYGGTLTQSLTIPSGETWNFQPGVTVTFASGTSLTVNGTLNAVGTSSNPITFNRSGSSGTWGGIQFNNGSSGVLQYCNISNASVGVYFYNSSSTQIKYCTFEYNGTAISCYYYSSPQVIYNSNFRYNTVDGLRCNSYSSPLLLNYGYTGYNVIRNNSRYGVYASYNSNPVLGQNNQAMYYGLNSIFNNSSCEVLAEYNCNIIAQNNWWGAATPNPYEFCSSDATITYLPALSTNPNPNRSIITTPEVDISPIKGISLNKQGDDLATALDKQKDKKYDEAIPLFLGVFKNNKDSLLGKFALSKIEECFTQAGKKDFLEYSKKELRPLIKSSSETFIVILELETHQLVNAGLYKEAMDNLFLIKEKHNLNEYIEKNTLYRIGVFYSDLYGDKNNAKKYFDDLKDKYPTDDLVNDIDRWLNSTNGESKYGSYEPAVQIGGDDSSSKDASIAIENYPNPFNPSTKISFTIPEKGNVKLKVFDVLGREISILADGVYEAGKYEISFDAANLPSGIYFCNLVSGSNSITKKMLLVK